MIMLNTMISFKLLLHRHWNGIRDRAETKELMLKWRNIQFKQSLRSIENVVYYSITEHCFCCFIFLLLLNSLLFHFISCRWMWFWYFLAVYWYYLHTTIINNSSDNARCWKKKRKNIVAFAYSVPRK